MRIEPQISGVSIVCLGHFNPLIFRPDWFKEKEIVVGSDVEGIKIDIVHSEVVSFRLPWGQMVVDRDRFMITALQEPLIRAQDFFVGTFQRLPETPISACGFNRDVHFLVGSEEALDRIGDALAPKEPWGDFVKRDGKKAGGVRSLTMEQSVMVEGRLTRLDGARGWVRVLVEPSIKALPWGIFVQINDHFDLTDGDRIADGKEVAELALAKWEQSIKSAELMVDRIMGLGDAV